MIKKAESGSWRQAETVETTGETQVAVISISAAVSGLPQVLPTPKRKLQISKTSDAHRVQIAAVTASPPIVHS